jgi:hypothetical protein
MRDRKIGRRTALGRHVDPARALVTLTLKVGESSTPQFDPE